MTRLAGLLLVLAVLVTGCVSVPTDGPVVEGRPAGEPVPPPNVAVLPTGPREGDSPVAIVEGFLSSMASYEAGYPTARLFLTPRASSQWRPESGIAVYGAGEGSRSVSPTDQGVQISLGLVAEVAEDGSYTPSEEGSRLVLDLRLTQVSGEWRIANPPQGLVMTAFDFTREFASFASYFYDPSFSVLVPDLTYLPVRGNLPTLLVEELLDGPTDWLAPGVRSAIDPGVTLSSGAVVQSGTVAQVDLSSQVALIPEEQRDRIAAQLAWTLRQAPGVAEVAVLADGRPVPLPTSPTGVVSAEEYAFYDPATVPAGDALFAVADGQVVEVDDDAAEAVEGPLNDDGPFRSVGVSVTGTRAAAVSEDGTTLTRSGLTEEGLARTVSIGADLSVPSFDRRDLVWVVDRGEQTSRVVVLDGAGAGETVIGETAAGETAAGETAAGEPSEGEVRAVAAPDLEQVRVERLAIAPDGVRAAAVYSAESGRGLALAIVLEDEVEGLRLGQVREVPLGQVEAVDVAWASATALAVLGVDPDQPQPYLVELSNAALSSRGQVEGVVSLAAAPGQPLVLGTRRAADEVPGEDGVAQDTASDDGASEEGAAPDEEVGEPRQSPVIVRQDALQEWVPLVEGQAPTYPG